MEFVRCPPGEIMMDSGRLVGFDGKMVKKRVRFAKSFFLAKILYEYTMNYLHQEKSIRDHEACQERDSAGYAYLW